MDYLEYYGQDDGLRLVPTLSCDLSGMLYLHLKAMRSMMLRSFSGKFLYDRKKFEVI